MHCHALIALLRRSIVTAFIAGMLLPGLSAAQPTLTVRDTAFAELFGLGGFKDWLIKVSLSVPSSQTVTVLANVTGITAEKGAVCGTTADFFGGPVTLTFPPNTTEGTYVLSICGDDVIEQNETLKLALSNPVNATIGPDAIITIVDDDTPVSRAFISSAPSSPFAENASGPLNAIFTIRVAPPSTAPVVVKYQLVDQTATGGTSCSGSADYVGASGALAFAPNETEKTVTIPICNDSRIDLASESFLFKLVSAANAVLGAPTGESGNMPSASGTSRQIAIVDDDKPIVTMSGAGPEPTSGQNQMPVILTLNKPLEEAFTFQYSTDLNSGVAPFRATSGTACIGASDYVAIPPTAVTFAKNEVKKTIPLTVCADTSIERDEQLKLVLETTPAGNVVSTGVITIMNVNFPRVSVADRSVEPSTDQTPIDVGVVVTLEPRAGEPATVSYTTADGTLTGGTFCGGGTNGYVATSGTLTFTGGGSDVPPPPGSVPGNFITDHTQTRVLTVRLCKRSTPSTGAVRILLTSATNAVIGDGAADIKIVKP